jgi:hypothetical protein
MPFRQLSNAAVDSPTNAGECLKSIPWRGLRQLIAGTMLKDELRGPTVFAID